MNIGLILFLITVVLLLAYRLTSPTRARLAEAPDPRLVMSIVVSLVILAAGLYVILSQRYEADVQKWAFGAVGTVIGFWLKP